MVHPVQKALKSTTFTAHSRGGASGGSGATVRMYDTDTHGTVFVKEASGDEGKSVLDGEYASLCAIYETNTIRVPRPHVCISDGRTHYMAVEYLRMERCANQRLLGENLARLHKHNLTSRSVKQFGFGIPTHCGRIAQHNEWNDDWVQFLVQRRLQPQIDMLLSSRNVELRDLWTDLKEVVSTYFPSSLAIQPSLLHGDLWSGNVAAVDGQPVIYDPASFYGHHEYDFGIARMFGGFTRAFYDGYDSVIPPEAESGQRNNRLLLYELFHHLNHWNHFGSSYAHGALSLMRRLIK